MSRLVRTPGFARFGRIAAAVPLAAALLSTGVLGATAQDDDPLQVVATNSIIGDFVENVAGDRVELTVLVPAGGDAHTFEPTPADAGTIADADLIFENGLGFELWLDDLYESSGTDADRVVVTSAITPLEAGEGHDHEGEEHEGEDHDHEGEGEEHDHADEATPGANEGDDHEHEGEEDHEHEGEDHEHEGEDHEHEGEDHEGEEGDEHEHGEYDPHVWLDARNAILMVEAIETALAEADAANADAYQADADAYVAELEALDAEIVAQVETIPEENRKLVTSHDTFAYFADRYGFEVVGTALGSTTTESSDPSAAEIAELVDEIVATGVPAIFPENVSDAGLTEQIASEAGVEVAPPLYTDALGEPGSEGETYIAMMTYNATTIATALGA